MFTMEFKILKLMSEGYKTLQPLIALNIGIEEPIDIEACLIEEKIY